MLPPVLKYGVTFEAHPQNTLAPFDSATGELKGFVIRDFGGLRLHAETLLSSLASSNPEEPSSPYTADPSSSLPPLSSLTGILDHTSALACALAEDVYIRVCNTAIINHLQGLIRALRLYCDGTPWEVVKKRLRSMRRGDMS
ncbi:hypothetical protein K439DRAFT_1637862 [Ramaria rubella]|nr:hypothetical protein K439DRAFT_1637862 [Ramaria rubella]